MRVLMMTSCFLRRLWRHRPLSVVLMTVPFVVALLRACLAGADFTRVGVMVCPFVCAGLTTGAIYVLHVSDLISGHMDGLRSCPGGGAVGLSRALVWMWIFGCQMGIMFGILAVRF